MTHMGEIGRRSGRLRIGVRVLCMRRHSIIAGRVCRPIFLRKRRVKWLTAHLSRWYTLRMIFGDNGVSDGHSVQNDIAEPDNDVLRSTAWGQRAFFFT